MKNVIKNTKKGILMVTVFATLLSFANEAPFYTIKNDAKRTSLTLVNVKQGNLLSIKDENGIILDKEIIKQSGIYSKGFDLTKLPDGGYFFELDKDLEINTIPFTVNSSEVTFKKELKKTIFKPFTKVKGDVVILSKLSLNADPLQIKIYFNSLDSIASELIFAETITNTININRVYKLSGLSRGDYKIVFNTEGRVFTKEINN